MQVIAGAAGIGGKQQQQPTHQRPGRGGQTMRPGNFPGRNHRRTQHHRLQNLQGGRIRCQGKKGQHQIVHRRDMNRKVGQQPIPFQSCQGLPGFFHIMKHLAEQTIIKGGGIEAIHSAHRPQADKQDKCYGQPQGNPAIAPLARQGVPPRLRAAVPPPQGKAGNHRRQQHAAAQKSPAEGGQQRKGGQHPHPQHQAAALPFSGIAHQRQQTQQRKDAPGQCQRKAQGHGPQSI